MDKKNLIIPRGYQSVESYLEERSKIITETNDSLKDLSNKERMVIIERVMKPKIKTLYFDKLDNPFTVETVDEDDKDEKVCAVFTLRHIRLEYREFVPMSLDNDDKAKTLGIYTDVLMHLSYSENLYEDEGDFAGRYLGYEDNLPSKETELMFKTSAHLIHCTSKKHCFYLKSVADYFIDMLKTANQPVYGKNAKLAV